MRSVDADLVCGTLAAFLAGEIDNLKTLVVDGDSLEEHEDLTVEYGVDSPRMLDGEIVVTLHPVEGPAFNLAFTVSLVDDESPTVSDL